VDNVDRIEVEGGASQSLPPPFPFSGDAALREPIINALRKIVDPEIALPILDIGLVYGVTIANGVARVRLTMTSAGCPLSDLILEEIHTELEHVLPSDHVIEIELCWEPAWTPERMTQRGRRVMGW
jgi:metal-sulfur cluster biosynthetic enzyme